MAGDHAQSDRPQELRLAGPGGADAEPVWPDSALRCLPDVEFESATIGPEPQRHPRPVTVHDVPQGVHGSADQNRPAARRVHSAVAAGPMFAIRRAQVSASPVCHRIRPCHGNDPRDR